MLDLCTGITKSEEWRDWVTRGATAFDLETIRRIFTASYKRADGTTDMLALRNKGIAVLLVIFGGHAIDLWRMHEELVEDKPDHHDREGYHRPKLLIRGHHTKRENWKVTNVVGCGCPEHHDLRNENCFYNLIKTYKFAKKNLHMFAVAAADMSFMLSDNGLNRMNYEQRKVHIDEEGRLLKTDFWRVYSDKHKMFIHQGLGDVPIRKVFKYKAYSLFFENSYILIYEFEALHWNVRLSLGLDKATSAMARKTFCTIGERYTRRVHFKFPRQQLPNQYSAMKISHHKCPKQFMAYIVDTPWQDLEQEAHVGRTFNLWGTGHYQLFENVII